MALMDALKRLRAVETWQSLPVEVQTRWLRWIDGARPGWKAARTYEAARQISLGKRPRRRLWFTLGELQLLEWLGI